jgi:hypothetical protein
MMGVPVVFVLAWRSPRRNIRWAAKMGGGFTGRRFTRRIGREKGGKDPFPEDG